MTIRNVGPAATYPTIAAAVAASAAGDIISLAPGYSNERAVLTVQNLTVTGAASSLNIDLVLGLGIGDVTLAGLANIDVWDKGGANNITGNGGNNTVRVSGGADVVLGGGGLDHLVINYADAVTSVIGTVTSVTDGGTNSVTFDAAVENFTILTGSNDDTVTTGDGDNVLRSGDGNDTITTGQGDSSIASGAGNDTIGVGGGQNAVYSGFGDDTVTTGDGGNQVNAGDGNNTVTTGGGADTVASGGGNDTLATGGDDDIVQVSGGIDTLDAGVGHDLLIVDYGHLLTNVTGSLSAGSVTVGYTGVVAATANSVSFGGVEHFQITTGAGDDRVRTGGGDDTIVGGLGQDWLHAGAGDDVLTGGGDADTLMGGRGADVMTGGLGVDCFRFYELDSILRATDLITDLEAQDTVDLSRMDANVMAAGDQAFVFVASFSGAAGEATLTYQAGANVTRLAFDTNGDGVANIAIVAVGDHRTFDSFVL